MVENKYPDHIMEYVRQNLGLEAKDTSRDANINDMPRERILERVCNWNGLINHHDTIKGWIEDIYNVDLEDYS